jgi:hypothetical protein
MDTCDIGFWLKIIALAIAAAGLAFAWLKFPRAGIILTAISVLIQGYATFTPTCASIFDMRNLPVVGGPARPAR